jgi:hypothetical protein
MNTIEQRKVELCERILSKERIKRIGLPPLEDGRHESKH